MKKAKKPKSDHESGDSTIQSPAHFNDEEVCSLTIGKVEPKKAKVYKSRRGPKDHERYEERKASGVCVKCGKNPPVEDGAHCQVCLDAQRVKQQKTAELKVAAKAERLAKLTEQRRAAETCIDCGKHEPFREERCRWCFIKWAPHNGIKRHDAKKLTGICTNCDEFATNGVKCAKHAQAKRDKRTANIEAYLCTQCGDPVTEGTKCADCKKDSCDLWTERTANNLCPRCGEPAIRPGGPCAEHDEDNRVKDRRKTAKARQEILDAYGCECNWPGCTCTDPNMLELDHINNDGAEERRQMTGKQAGSGYRQYAYVRKQGFPKDRYQILCANHNRAKARGVIQPGFKHLGFSSQDQTLPN